QMIFGASFARMATLCTTSGLSAPVWCVFSDTCESTCMRYQSVHEFLHSVAQRNPGQPEYLQAVAEVMESLWPFIAQHPRYAEHSLLDRLVEPERLIQFRVSWVDDQGDVHVNRGYRIQHNSAIGPFKGGLRFHPSVNQSVLKFLAFEQTLKNALTTLRSEERRGGNEST